MSTRLSEHFDLEEFAVSAKFPDLVQPVPAAYVPNVRALVTTILEPIRVHIARPIRILSCYRPTALNTAVGGSPTSQHVRAEAADFTTEHIEDVFRWLFQRQPRLPSGQIILYPAPRSFIHVALPGERYPAPSFHVHNPALGMRYTRVSSVPSLVRMLSGAAA